MGGRDRDPGVVDQHIEPAESLCMGGERGYQLSLVAHVGDVFVDLDAAGAQVVGCGGKPIPLPGHHSDTRITELPPPPATRFRTTAPARSTCRDRHGGTGPPSYAETVCSSPVTWSPRPAW
jgi:hypothetical protein